MEIPERYPGFRKRLTEGMLAHGFAQPNGKPDARAFARRLDTNPENVYRWLKGPMFPVQFLPRIAQLLETTPSYLQYGGAGRKTAQSLQSSGTDAARSASMERRLAKAELDRAWLQVGVAYETRRERPDRWKMVREWLDRHVANPEEERTDFQSRKRAGRR